MDSLTLAGRPINRLGYGAMQLEKVDRAAATAVLHRAVELGVNHLDTASFYGDAVVNGHLRAALSPYASDLVIVSKVGARRVDAPVPLALAQRPSELRAQVQLDLDTLGLDQIAVVNLRRADQGPGLIASGADVVALDDQLAELVALRDAGLIGAIGLSNVSLDQIKQAFPVGIACVQNAYGLLDRTHEDELLFCASNDIPWVPYFPLGSAFDQFPSPTEHPAVQGIAAAHATTPAAITLAWILAHSNNTAPIPGTRTLAHLEENLSAADVVLTPEDLATLDALA
ncbi:aldo/keto reductase [Kribbella antibiotica]|uniref:Aldo/keto reductase n=1 Tax=Kribbella antibiotica TaxID=190195 RepID=A0A4R4YWN0_9ACTN|nr:aldo/keto reductase [Kribbella antibiotica]TDD49766.1 aldo/keto reductase [Kribbella antibiotica]